VDDLLGYFGVRASGGLGGVFLLALDMVMKGFEDVGETWDQFERVGVAVLLVDVVELLEEEDGR
jgi:hypothetical protein